MVSWVSFASASVRSLPGVGPMVAKKLDRLGILTINDLVWHLPRTWLDLTKPSPIALLQRDNFGVIQATVRHPLIERTSRRQMTVLRVELEDRTGDRIRAIWFNQPFLEPQLREGSEWLFWGLVKFDFTQRALILSSPKFAKTGSILPIYPETDGLTSAFLRRLIQPLLTKLDRPDYLSDDLRGAVAEALVSRTEALRQLHAPTLMADVAAGRARIALDELTRLFLILGRRRSKRQLGRAPLIPMPTKAIQALTKALPFTLTNAQRKAAWQILKDLDRTRPMARLLLGDVGSGKTVVALIGSYAALKAGQRVVWLAPTQLLAEQHLATVQRFAPSDVAAPRLVTGTTKPISIASEQFLIGTHALLNVAEGLTNLGLVIIDEQHRFGVKQRRALLANRSSQQPHLLTMTATPIPRSLALTVFSDLDCSFLDEIPSGRKPIITKVIEPALRGKAYDLVSRELAAGRQAFVVCPTIDPSTALGTSPVRLDFDQDSRAVTKRFEALSADPRFARFKIALLHGKMKASEKQRTMTAFAANTIQLLVTTSLIEVGIDVPNATVLVIEGADHFGLAQLHQLRGRVGRGDRQSLCVAIADNWSAVAKKRLAVFERSTNGFELAEFDLKLRGPGDLLGDLQAGLPPLKLANLADTLMVERARTLARQLEARARSDRTLAQSFEQFVGDSDGVDHPVA
jgi:ATP-dependent DNA helicase RecG